VSKKASRLLSLKVKRLLDDTISKLKSLWIAQFRKA